MWIHFIGRLGSFGFVAVLPATWEAWLGSLLHWAYFSSTRVCPADLKPKGSSYLEARSSGRHDDAEEQAWLGKHVFSLILSSILQPAKWSSSSKGMRTVLPRLERTVKEAKCGSGRQRTETDHLICQRNSRGSKHGV